VCFLYSSSVKMQFKTAAFAAFLAAAATPFAAAQCAEASRFGDTSITPTTFAPGDVCAIHSLYPWRAQDADRDNLLRPASHTSSSPTSPVE
jgi:hypothetical protein